MRRIHNNSLSIVKYTLFVFAMLLTEGAQDSRIFNKLYDFVIGKEDQDNENSTDNYLAFIVMCIAAMPLVLTMLSTWKKHTHSHSTSPENKNFYGNDYWAEDDDNGFVIHSEYEDDSLIATSEAVHHHSYTETITDCTAIALPFAVLSYSGLNRQLQFALPEVRYTFNIIGALVAGFGNYQLHKAHAHAEDGIKTLFGQIPARQKPKILLICLGVIIGHFLQGYSAGSAFVDNVPTTSNTTHILSFIIPPILAILVTLFEANTETRSMLLLELSEQKHSVSLFTKFATTIAATVHGSIPVLGTIQIIDFLMQQLGKSSLTSLPWYFRVGILSLATVLFGLPNARGFYCTTILTTNEALKTTFKTIKGYKDLLCYGTCQDAKSIKNRRGSRSTSAELQTSLTPPLSLDNTSTTPRTLQSIL